MKEERVRGEGTTDAVVGKEVAGLAKPAYSEACLCVYTCTRNSKVWDIAFISSYVGTVNPRNKSSFKGLPCFVTLT